VGCRQEAGSYLDTHNHAYSTSQGLWGVGHLPPVDARRSEAPPRTVCTPAEPTPAINCTEQNQ
jgi:hypothetical protein